LNLFAFRPDWNIGATLRLLQNNNALEILAERISSRSAARKRAFWRVASFHFR